MSKVQPSANDAVQWENGPSLKGREDNFVLQQVRSEKVLKSWRYSLFSHEWLDHEGRILQIEAMIEKEQKKRQEVLKKLKDGKSLEYAILGIGLNDNVEIGAGRAVFLTLAAEGYKVLPVYVPKSCLEEFNSYLA